MPYIINKGVRIYYEVKGKGPPLFLHHGVSARGENWRDSGWVDLLAADYQLIIIDARGHGQSDKLPDVEEYALRLFAEDVLAILNELNIQQTAYFGYSLGGFVGLELARLFPGRLQKLVIGGADPEGFAGKSWQAVDGLRQLFRVGAEHGGEA